MSHRKIDECLHQEGNCHGCGQPIKEIARIAKDILDDVAQNQPLFDKLLELVDEAPNDAVKVSLVTALLQMVGIGTDCEKDILILQFDALLHFHPKQVEVEMARARVAAVRTVGKA